MSVIALTVNGQSHTVDVDPATPLLFVLSDDLALRGPKFGCGLGQCGACTVLLENRAVRSCVTTVSAVTGMSVTTLEGLGTVDRPHPIQQAFIDEQAAQCGFCLSGVILTAKSFIDQNPMATDAQIRQALSTVLCRCFAHTRMLRAIKRYAAVRQRGAIATAAELDASSFIDGPRDPIRALCAPADQPSLAWGPTSTPAAGADSLRPSQRGCRVGDAGASRAAAGAEVPRDA